MSTNKFKERYNNSTLSRAVKSSRQDLLAGISSTRQLAGALVVPLELIVPNRFQVRQIFDETSLQELAEDITARGVLEPLLVRTNDDEQYEIIAGERRYRAAKLAGLTEVPVLVREMEDQEAQLVTLVENIQRENLDPRDEQRFFQQMQNEFNFSITDIAQLIKKSRDYVRQRVDGTLASMQIAATPSVPEAPANSDEIHDVSQPDKLIQNSQSVVKPRFAPAALKRCNQTLDKTFLYLEQTQPDPNVREHIVKTLAEMEARIQRIRARLD